MSHRRKILLAVLLLITTLATSAFIPPMDEPVSQPVPQQGVPNAPYFKYARNSIGFVDQINVQSTSLQILGKNLYSGYTHFDILDMTNPADLQVLDRVVTNFVYGFSMHEKKAYVALQDFGLVSMDTTVDTLSDYAKVPMKESAYGTALADGYLYVANGVHGVWILDESKPTDLPTVGMIHMTGFASGVAVEDNTAYVANGYYGIRVFDVTDKANPKEISSLPLQGYAASITLNGSVAYVADSFGGVRILDISDRSAPIEATRIKTPGAAVKVVLRDNYAYIACREGGIQIYDISDWRAPVLVASYYSPGGSWDLAVLGNYVFLADMPAGIRVLYFIPPVRASVSNNGGNVSSTSDQVSYTFAPGTFATDAYVTHQPLYHTSVYENSIYQPKVGPFFQILAVDERGAPVKPSKPFQIRVPYSDAGIDPLREFALTLYWWNGTAWVKVQEQQVDSENNILTATVDRFAIYGVFLDKTLPPKK